MIESTHVQVATNFGQVKQAHDVNINMAKEIVKAKTMAKDTAKAKAMAKAQVCESDVSNARNHAS